MWFCPLRFEPERRAGSSRIERMDTELIRDLAALRRGRGVRRPNPRSWIGARLTKVLTDCVGSMETAEDLRRALIDELWAATAELPKDLASAYLAANAITATEAPLLQERLDLISVQHDRHPRTVRRRLAEADALIAAALARRVELRAAEDAIIRRGWELDSFAVELRLDLPRPVHRTRRTSRVTTDSLREFTDVFGLTPTGEGSIRIEALDGCTLIESKQVSESLWRTRFALPRQLTEGETHTVGISIEVPSAAAVEPFMIMIPVRPCREFRCRVIIGDSGAHSFECIDGLPPLAVQDSGPIGIPMTPVANVVEVGFPDLTCGLAYGLRWSVPGG